MNKLPIVAFVLAACSLPLQAAEPVRIVLDKAAPDALAQSIGAILPSHPLTRAAKARLEAARANLRAADKGSYNPELEIDTEDTDINTSYIQLSQTFDVGGKRGSRTSMAEAGLIRARAEYIQARQSLSNKLLSAMAENNTRQQLARLAERGLKLMKEFADIAEQRHRAGDLNQVELDLARLAYNEALMQHAQALADAAESNQRLRALFADDTDNLPALPESMPTPRLPDDMDPFLLGLPAMQALRAEVDVAKYNVKLRQSERSWDPTFALRGGREDQQTLLGATFSIPLNIVNAYKAEVDVANQERISVEQEAQQMFRNLRGEVLSTTERYRLLQVAWRNWKQSGRISVNRQLKLIKKLWRAGDMSTAEYLIQLKQALDTQAAGLSLRGQLWRSGFNWMNTTASIDTWLNLNDKGSE